MSIGTLIPMTTINQASSRVRSFLAASTIDEQCGVYGHDGNAHGLLSTLELLDADKNLIIDAYLDEHEDDDNLVMYSEVEDWCADSYGTVSWNNGKTFVHFDGGFVVNTRADLKLLLSVLDHMDKSP